MVSSVLLNEMLEEVFCRLPVKSILRFRSVCKWCLQLSSDPGFIKRHLDTTLANINNNEGYIFAEYRAINNSGHFAFHSDKTFQEKTRLHLPPHLPFENNWVVGDSYGLICLYTFTIYGLYLWNPAIRKLKLLPYPLQHSHPDTTLFVNLSFGYVPQDKDCKVLKFLYRNEGQYFSPKIELYSLKDDSWKIIVRVVPGVIYNHGSATTGGVVNWIAFSTQRQKPIILSFDMANDHEVFSEIDIPEYHSYRRLTLKVLDGLLALISLCLDNDGFPHDIWVLKESWTKQFTFTQRLGGCLGSLKNGGLVLKAGAPVLVFYDPKDQDVKRLPILARKDLVYFTSFVQTLAML